MSMSKCSACGADLSSSEGACPSCGVAVRAKRISGLAYFILGLLAVAIFVRAMEMAETGVHGLSMYSPF